MARATLVKTAKSRKRVQPVCTKCAEAIEPGQMRWTWSFRFGGTYNRHEACGRPRPSELTQGRVGELYAAQEAVEDVTQNFGGDAAEFESFKEDVVSALESAKDTAEELTEAYREAAEPFGGEGENAERADACEEWATTLEEAISAVEGVEMDEVDDDRLGFTGMDDEDWTNYLAEQAADVLDRAVGEVVSAAEDACGELAL